MDVLQGHLAFSVTPDRLQAAFVRAELALASAVRLADAARRLFTGLSQPLLSGVEVSSHAANSSSCSSAGGAPPRAWLALSLLLPDARAKARLLLALDGLLAGGHAGAVRCCFCSGLEQ